MSAAPYSENPIQSNPDQFELRYVEFLALNSDANDYNKKKFSCVCSSK